MSSAGWRTTGAGALIGATALIAVAAVDTSRVKDPAGRALRRGSGLEILRPAAAPRLSASSPERELRIPRGLPRAADDAHHPAVAGPTRVRDPQVRSAALSWLQSFVVRGSTTTASPSAPAASPARARGAASGLKQRVGRIDAFHDGGAVTVFAEILHGSGSGRPGDLVIELRLVRNAGRWVVRAALL